MSEIIKLYKNAGIEPEQQDCCKIADKYWAYNTEKGFEYLMQKECPYNQECTDECEYAYDKVVYPSFTAEKQLELIKLLAKIANIYITYYPFDNTYNIRYRVIGLYDGSVMGSREVTNTDFEETLAGLINTLWQDLTEAEKAQIKEILE